MNPFLLPVSLQFFFYKEGFGIKITPESEYAIKTKKPNLKNVSNEILAWKVFFKLLNT